MHIGTRPAYLENYSGVRWTCKNDTCDLLNARGKSATEAHYTVAQQQIKIKFTSGMSAMSVSMPFLLESEHSLAHRNPARNPNPGPDPGPTKPNVIHACVCLMRERERSLDQEAYLAKRRKARQDSQLLQLEHCIMCYASRLTQGAWFALYVLLNWQNEYTQTTSAATACCLTRT